MKSLKLWLLGSALALLLVGGVEIAYAYKYQNRIYPGISIGNIHVGELAPREAEALLKTRIDSLLTSELLFILDGKILKIAPRVLSPDDPDLARERINLSYETALQNSFNHGRSKNPILNIAEQIKARRGNITFQISVRLDQEEITNEMHHRASRYLTPKQNATIKILWPEEGTEPEISIQEEQAGTTFDAAAAVRETETVLARLVSVEIELQTNSDPPTITAPEAAPFLEEVAELLAFGPREIRAEEETWTMDTKRFSELITLVKHDGEVVLSLESSALETLFLEIEEVINRPPRNAKFKLEDGRVVEFQASLEGRALDREASASIMEEVFFGTEEEADQEAELVILTTPPALTTADVNDLGIEQVLGIGVSNFRGSPLNRVKNIKNGARLVNGTLVKPGDEFSLLAPLAPFTIENGYLPELVIKGDEIIPEVGGGLCQIGTTAFRATMKSGLPVTMRRNHSLVVNYYSDPRNGNPGTDATIYSPFPDLRFLNDTPAHILITTEVVENKTELHFIFWGTPDGRTGDYSAPVVHRWIPTGPTKNVETTDLEPGERQCQSKHAGADASFTYTITRSGGIKEETIYESHYRPLPEMCLVGVEEETDEAEDESGEN